ncbi:MAG: ribonuclease P protein component [Prevotella sp.]|nr:ribonuclease P protein component [Prevotella sp.]
MEQPRATFPKRERIVSQKLIDQLFLAGQSRSQGAFPLRAVYHLRPRTEADEPLQVLISVPKKHLHHAVDRNRAKRQVREAFRLHKQLLVSSLPADKALLVAFVWLADVPFATRTIEDRVEKLLSRIAEKLAS